MNKILYISLLIFFGISTALSITNSIARFQVGASIFTFGSYVGWFLLTNVNSVICSMLLLKYYYHRNYKFAVFTGAISIVANLGLSTILYIMLTSGELRNYSSPAFLLSLIIGIVYALGLIFSNSRERFWLKIAGAYTLFISMLFLLTVIGVLYLHIGWISVLSAKIGQWYDIAADLVPVLYMMNFLNEFRMPQTENSNTPKQEALGIVLGLLVTTVVAFAIVFGTSLVNESATELFWQKNNAEKAQQLVKLSGGARTFVDRKNETLQYLLIKPQNYDRQKKYPLVVCLPYGGYEASAAELLTTEFNRRQYPAFILVPYCLEGTGWGGIPGAVDKDLLVYETIDALKDPGIDVNRLYVTGVSRGGYGTWQFICARPFMFAAAIPVCGGGNPKLAPGIISVPIWAFHGAKDKNVPVSGSRDMIEAIKKAGGYPRYTEFPNEGHNIWDKVSETPGLLDWLFAQKRR